MERLLDIKMSIVPGEVLLKMSTMDLIRLFQEAANVVSLKSVLE